MIAWRRPEVKISIHLKGIYCSKNAHFLNLLVKSETMLANSCVLILIKIIKI